MSFIATWTILNPDAKNDGDELLVRTPAEVAALIDALSRPGATAALIRHEQRTMVTDDTGELVPDHDMTAGVWKGYGYLTYADMTHNYETLVGDAASPSFAAHYVEYDAGTGVSIELLAAALVEFLETAQRPTKVAWQDVL